MEKWLTSYLFEYKSCPLPSVGSLILQQGQAKLLPGEKKILAPRPSMGLHDKEISSYGLTGYLARQQDISINDAAAQLSTFCSQLHQLQSQEELPFSGIGVFYKEREGKLRFRSAELPEAFLPDVVAERVIHRDVAHNMIVGSRETNTTAMSSELLADGPPAKSKWWIAALVLATIGIAVIATWLTTDRKKSFGNATEITPATAPKTYRTGDK
jgi:hypothetical protein